MAAPSEQERRTFRDRFCAQFHCAPHYFERRVLRQCFHRYAQWPCRFLLNFFPSYFEQDLELIGLLGQTRRFSDCKEQLAIFRAKYKPAGFFRGRLKIRASGRKILRLAKSVFHSHVLHRASEADES